MKGFLFVFLFLALTCMVYADGFVSNAYAYWNLTWNQNCDNTEGPIEGDPVVRVCPAPVPPLAFDHDLGVYTNKWNTPSLDENNYYEYQLHSSGHVTMVCFYLTLQVTDPNMHCAMRYSTNGFTTHQSLPNILGYDFHTGNPYQYYWGALYQTLYPGETLTIRVYAWGAANESDLLYNKLLYLCGLIYDDTLPVELTSFTATPSVNGNITESVTLNWTTHSETNVLGYSVYRNTDINFNNATCLTQSTGLIPANNTSNTQNYSFVDNEIGSEPETYYYWLQYTEFSGDSFTTNPIRVDVNSTTPPPVPAAESSIQSIGPNPFNNVTTIQYGMKSSEDVTLNVYNIRGQLVKTLYSGYRVASDYTTSWDGKDNKGSECASGIYYVVMRSSSSHSFRKILKF